MNRRRRDRVPGFVIQENPALPIVGMDAKDLIGKEQSGMLGFRSVTGNGALRYADWC